MSKVMTPAEFAVEVGSDGRTVRKFLRSITPKDEQPGKGSRWSIPANANQLRKLRKQFDEWNTPAPEETEPEVEETEDEVETPEA